VSLRPLTNSERHKLWLFLGLLLVLGSLFGGQRLLQYQRHLTSEIIRLQADKIYAATWLEQKAYWQERREWLTQNQPQLADPAQGNVLLLETLQKSVKECNLTILEQTLLEPRPEKYYNEAAVQLRLTGSLEAICRWLVTVQKPLEFQALGNCSLKTDTDPNKIKCEVRVARWYR
jgi:hypothetical protein